MANSREYLLKHPPAAEFKNHLILDEEKGEIKVDYTPCGSGRMGIVFAAHVKDKKYAIKYFYHNSEVSLEDARTRALHEYKVWQCVHSVKNKGLMGFAGVVTPRENNHVFPYALLFDWCDSLTLLEFLKGGYKKLSRQHLLAYFVNLLTGLKALHDQNILHADIAGRNIMLTKQEDGSYLPVLIDPGDAVLPGEPLLPQQKLKNPWGGKFKSSVSRCT